MWNQVFQEHREKHPLCTGKLEWDTTSERQQGLCWSEVAKCTVCTYSSEPFKLFSEVHTRKPGQKAAAPNIGIQAGMAQTPVGYASLRRVLLAGNIPAPSHKGLYKSATKVSNTIIQTNEEDMKNRRKNLKDINTMRGQTNPEAISIESDGAYNNPIYSGIGKTPFQAATQATYIIAESVTHNRDIISLTTRNKLCLTGAKKNQTCPSNSHKCSASIPYTATIGNEQSMAEEGIRNIISDGLQISSITTDPDSGAAKAADSLYHQQLLKHKPEKFVDTRHLSDNQRKSVNKVNFSTNMFHGRTKEERAKLQRRFAHDLVKRCEAEFTEAQKRHAGDINMLTRTLTNAKCAIVQCYQQNHSECKKYSLVCTGGKLKNWLNNNKYNLPRDFKITCTADDEYMLHQCIAYRLGPKVLSKTRLGTNTQKVEATNRTLRRSLPKNVTYTTNFKGRAHAAVHSNNNGPGESIFKLCKQLGAPIAGGTKVARSLKGLQIERKKQLQYHMSGKAKTARCRKRQHLYKLYDEFQTENNSDYKKAILCPKISSKNKGEHSYCKTD